MATTALTLDAPNTPKWSAVPNGNQGAGWRLPPFRTAFFEATGTFGAGGSVQLEGSNDGTNYFKLSPAALTAAGVFAALANNEYPMFIRPNVTAGDGTTAITVTGNALVNE